MSYCLWCASEMITETTWSNLLSLSQPQKLCKTCKGKLQIITGNRCQKCSRESKSKICTDCKYWGKLLKNNDPLEKNYSIYSYNEFMKEVIAKWKYRGDYVLVEIFQTEFIRHFNTYIKNQMKEAIIIPIPLSKERLATRKFNQAQALTSFITQDKINILERVNSEKQAKKSRMERIQSENPFNLLEPINKPVILVDDIYTTGTTLRHVAQILKDNGCPSVYGYTLIRG
ncbi:ComF family protein [Cerasibacillus terrae]|uniref:ComF family protein n=1 Tax=Cerasibacillus terrae TaxID=2498845 RepID=A0A5C8NV49_9BACI|nr:ComF family protein [Cerasibacillus terrae]TXL65012.1 ComF family protein [Cerasibacillus terrae]